VRFVAVVVKGFSFGGMWLGDEIFSKKKWKFWNEN